MTLGGGEWHTPCLFANRHAAALVARCARRLPAHLDHRRQAVCGAGGGGHDVVVLSVVQLLHSRDGAGEGPLGIRACCDTTTRLSLMQAAQRCRAPATAPPPLPPPPLTPLTPLTPPLTLPLPRRLCRRRFLRQICAVCLPLTWLTPYTMLSTGLGSFTGADTTTFFTPCSSSWNQSTFNI